MKKIIVFSVFITIFIIILACTSQTPEKGEAPLPDRLSKIPEDAVKIMPEDDLFPPILHSDLWHKPVPMSSTINSKGGEDSAFITPDGKDFYLFFTPDVSIDASKQLVDEVTGIYWSKKDGDDWTEPVRVLLQERDKLSLDGCLFVQGDVMWFCSARVGNRREIDFYIAHLKDGRWTDWENAGELLNVDYGIGELHITSDGNQIYFHSVKEGGMGDMDIWVTSKIDGIWQEPENVSAVNSQEMDGWPFVSEDGKELWITRMYNGYPGIFRSIKDAGDNWSEPELIISQFAGEATLDNEGNIYFTHHFYEDAVMLEADIYVAYKK
jgi:ribosomal protein L24E